MPSTARELAVGPCAEAAPAPHQARAWSHRLVPVLLAAALGLPLVACDSADAEPACATLPPGAEASPLPSPTPCGDRGGP